MPKHLARAIIQVTDAERISAQREEAPVADVTTRIDLSNVGDYQSADSTVAQFANLTAEDLRAEVMNRPLSDAQHLLSLLPEVRREQQSRVESGWVLEERLREIIRSVAGESAATMETVPRLTRSL